MSLGQRQERLASGQILRRYERSTDGTVLVAAPISFYDDFLQTGTSVLGLNWAEIENTATATTPAGVGGGVLRLATSSGAIDQYAVVQSGVRLNVGVAGVTKFAQVEARLRVVGASTLAGHQAFFGLMGTSIPSLIGAGVFQEAQYLVGFVLGDATETISDSRDIFLTADDDITDTAAFDSGADFGVTLSNPVWKTYRIDLTDLSHVKFYLDGVLLNPNTAVPFLAVTETGATMGITLGLLKHTPEGDGIAASLECDYVRYWSVR